MYGKFPQLIHALKNESRKKFESLFLFKFVDIIGSWNIVDEVSAKFSWKTGFAFMMHWWGGWD